jgi:MYXO-CTERM domain-containing protein
VTDEAGNDQSSSMMFFVSANASSGGCACSVGSQGTPAGSIVFGLMLVLGLAIAIRRRA